MSERAVGRPVALAGVVAVWAAAVLGGVVALVVYPSVLIGYLFSLGLSEEPPHGADDFVIAVAILAVFAVVPLAVGVVLYRSLRRRLTNVLAGALSLWAVPVTSLACFAAWYMVAGLVA